MEVDERGGFTVGFSVDDYEYLESDRPDEGYVLERLLTGNQTMRDDGGRSTRISIAPHNVCTSFRLVTQEGVLQAVGSIKYQIGNDDSGNWSVGVFPFHLRYDVYGKEDAAYWAMPLSNFVAGFLQEPSPAARVNPLLVSKGGYSIIEFGSHGGRAFIERVPDYDTRIKELQEGKAINRVTSVMVGPVGEMAHGSFEALEEWIPFHLLWVLGLATGSEVASPWIELRNEEGELVRRFYVRLAAPVYVAGHTAISDALGLEKLGPLLSAASLPRAAGELNKSYLRVAIKLMIRAKLDSTTIEDGLASVTRAIDGLCQEFGLQKRPSVEDVLRETQVEELNDLLAKAAAGIRDMAESSSCRRNEPGGDAGGDCERNSKRHLSEDGVQQGCC